MTEERTKKSWIEENYPIENFSLYSDICLNEYKRDAIQEVCQKILEEVRCKIAEKQTLGFTFLQIDSEELKEIIKDLGIELNQKYFEIAKERIENT